MELEEKFAQSMNNQQRIADLGPMSAEQQRKLDYRFRLDWNYHSLTMEGNRFTREETQSIMSGLVNVSQKTVQDVQEMIGHDEVVQSVMKMASGEAGLSEKRLKELHKAIVFEEIPANRSKIGNWKTGDNYTYNYRNERVDYTSHADVKDAIHKLLDKVNGELSAVRDGKAGARNPLLVAFDLHADFLKIHPFHDGNGRMSRILLNIVLISVGYPPIVVKKDERETYGRLLTDLQFYESQRELYYDFMLDLVIRSQELVMKALRGEELEEEGDLEKKLELLKRRMELMGSENAVQKEFSMDVFQEAMQGWVKEFYMEFKKLAERFGALFIETSCEIGFSNVQSRHVHDLQRLTDEHIFTELLWLKDIEDGNKLFYNSNWRISLSFRELRQRVGNPLYISANFEIWFNKHDFRLTVPDNKDGGKLLLYHQYPSGKEIKQMVDAYGEQVLGQVEAYLNPKQA